MSLRPTIWSTIARSRTNRTVTKRNLILEGKKKDYTQYTIAESDLIFQNIFFSGNAMRFVEEKDREMVYGII